MAKQATMTWAEIRAQRENGVPIPLLSVPNARLRHVGPDSLIRNHKSMPAMLSTFALKAMNYNVTSDDFAAFLAPRETAEETLEVLDSLAVACKAAFVYPRIVDDVQGDDEITIDDVSPFDRGLAFRLMFLPAEVLRSVNLDDVVEAAPVAEQVAT